MVVEKAYQFLDDRIMEGINLGVKTWNYTTGKTKTDLANGLLTVAPILEGSGFFTIFGILGIPLTAAYILMSHDYQIENKKIGELEKQYENSGTIHPIVESWKNDTSQTMGGVFAATSIINTSATLNPLNPEPEGYALIATGNSLRSLSHYIMRADYIPPGKSILEKARDGIENLVESVKRERVSSPDYGFNHSPILEHQLS
jgi:hypothetical protein